MRTVRFWEALGGKLPFSFMVIGQNLTRRQRRHCVHKSAAHADLKAAAVTAGWAGPCLTATVQAEGLGMGTASVQIVNSGC
jgi:hypothetical protein